MKTLLEGDETMRRCESLIARFAPRFMRLGGALVQEIPSRAGEAVRAEEALEMAQRRARGESTAAIAVAMGRSGPTVSKWCRYLGVVAERHRSCRPIPPAVVARMRARRAAGLTLHAIAAEMGCSVSAVHKRLSGVIVAKAAA